MAALGCWSRGESASSPVKGSVFAYGQTNSGKTHTMRGSTAEPGVIPLGVLHLFHIIQELINEKPQVIQEYASWKAIPNQQIITKLESVLGVKLRGEVFYLTKDALLPVTLKAREYEVFTVVPVKELSNGSSFAPIGLIKMFNSGGASKELLYEADRNATVDMKVTGCGIFGSYYSSTSPKRITVDGEEIEFAYDESTCLVTRLECLVVGPECMYGI